MPPALSTDFRDRSCSACTERKSDVSSSCSFSQFPLGATDYLSRRHQPEGVASARAGGLSGVRAAQHQGYSEDTQAAC